MPRIELFSRGDAPGWDRWGNENPRNDIDLIPGYAQKHRQEIYFNDNNNPLKREA